MKTATDRPAETPTTNLPDLTKCASVARAAVNSYYSVPLECMVGVPEPIMWRDGKGDPYCPPCARRAIDKQLMQPRRHDLYPIPSFAPPSRFAVPDDDEIPQAPSATALQYDRDH